MVDLLHDLDAAGRRAKAADLAPVLVVAAGVGLHVGHGEADLWGGVVRGAGSARDGGGDRARAAASRLSPPPPTSASIR